MVGPASSHEPTGAGVALLAVVVENGVTRLGLFHDGPAGACGERDAGGSAGENGLAGANGENGSAGANGENCPSAPLDATSAPVATWELTTPVSLTADEARCQLAQALWAMGAGTPFDSALACVVPQFTDVWARALAATCGRRPLVVGPGVRSGIRMRYDDPAEVGADRVANVVAARASHGAPVVVVGMGTSTDFEVVDDDGAFVGGPIAPGMQLCGRALERAAARLPMVELRAPERVIARSTRCAVQAGVVLGQVALVDGLLDRIFDELGHEAPVVLTGADAEGMAGLLAHDASVEPDLALRGLAGIWASNRGCERRARG